VSSLLADVLGFWLLATAGCSALLAAVVGVQGALERARRRREVRR
jgi:hypothetical protein